MKWLSLLPTQPTWPPIVIPPPSGGGGSTPPPSGGGVPTPPGGGGGYTPPYTPPGGSGSQINHIDPCVTAKKIEKTLNDAIVNQKNEELRGKVDYEYAFTHQLNLNTNAITTSEIYTNDPPQTHSVSFKWQNYDPAKKTLYTGASHNHPGNEPPSLTDFYSFNGYYNTLPNDVRQTFLENHSQTIITTDRDYIVSIKEGTAWNTKGQQYMQGRMDEKNGVTSGARTAYKQQNNDVNRYMREFYMLSEDRTREHIHEESHLYALHKIAGDYMNFYIINREGTTIKVEPYTFDTNRNRVKINCNN